MKALTKAQLKHVAKQRKSSLLALRVLETNQELEEELALMQQGEYQPYFIWKDSSAWSAGSTASHWVAVLIENETKTAFGFNPRGLPLDKTVLDTLKKFPDMVQKVMWNAVPVQASDQPETWGHWCLYYLKAMTTSAGVEDGYRPAEEVHNAIVDSLTTGPKGCNEAILGMYGPAEELYEDLPESPAVGDFARNEAYLKKWWTQFLGLAE